MKKKKVLLIENNPAVQAQASLALSQIGYAVRTISKAAAIDENIEKIQPDAVICSDSVPGFDPLELSSRLKQTKASRNTVVLLLVDRDKEAEFQANPKISTIDEVLAKPFRTGQLTRAVQRAIANAYNVEEETSDALLLLIQDPFLQKVLEKLFDKNNIPWQLCEDTKELISATQKVAFPAIIAEWEAIEGVDWFDPEKMGELIVIMEDEANLMAIEKADKVHFITRPLSYKVIEKILSRVIEIGVERYAFNTRQLEQGAQAMLAARISAAIFERLINQQSLRDGQWDTAGEAAEEELLRVCNEFEKLFPMREQVGSSES